MEIMYENQLQIPDSIILTDRKQFMNYLMEHGRGFKEYHLKNHIFLTWIVMKQICQYHREKEKREQEKLNRQHIKLLRNNYTTGLREPLLLAEAKNDRLQMFMNQTDDLLTKINMMVQQEETEKQLEALTAKEEEELLENSKKLAAGETLKEPTSPSQQSSATTSTTTTTNTTNVSSPIVSTNNLLPKHAEQPEIMVGGRLKPYQITGLRWLISLFNRNLNGILADEMGLGKSVQTIAFICHLYEKCNVREPFLIVAPLGTIYSWANEFMKWAPRIPTIVYKGKPEEHKKLLGRHMWCYIIINEGHRNKNKSNRLNVQLRPYYTKHRLLLSGTPLQTDLEEQKPLISVTEEEILILINRLHEVLRFLLLRRLKSDVETQLPEKREQVIKCNLSAMQIAMYRNLVEKGILPMDPNSESYKKSISTFGGFNNVIKQLQKICNHPYLFFDDWDINDDIVRASGKFDLMDQILIKMKASGHRVLIFTQMPEVINLMEEYFGYREWDYLRLDSSTKPEELGKLVVEWNRPDSPFWIFVLSTHAGCLNMILQTADTVIIFDSDWNQQVDLQVQDRCHRIGQTNSVNVFRLISANSIEEKNLERPIDKLEIDAKINQAGMFNTHSNDQERRAKLDQFLHGFPNTIEEVPTDLEKINRLISIDDEEFEQFQKIDKDRQIQEQNKYKLLKTTRKTRLVSESELPEWMLNDPLEERNQTISGKRANIKFLDIDDPTELQYSKMTEKVISFEEFKSQLDEKKRKREARA
eukprot:gene12954-15824_t